MFVDHRLVPIPHAGHQCYIISNPFVKVTNKSTEHNNPDTHTPTHRIVDFKHGQPNQFKSALDFCWTK